MKLLIETRAPGTKPTRLILDYPGLENWSKPNPLTGMRGDQIIAISNIRKMFTKHLGQPCYITIIKEKPPNALRRFLRSLSHSTEDKPLEVNQ